MTKKIFAMFLAVLMVVSVLPASVFAANECPGKDSPKHSTSNCDYTEVSVTDPTCGTAGHTTYKCNVCGYTFAEKTAPATGEHSYVPGEAEAPTCTKPGWEAGLVCEVCGDEKPGKEIPALGKDGTDACEWELVSGYDCDDKNGKLVFKCAFCGDVEEITREENGDKNPRDHVIYWNQYVAISATQAAFFCIGALNGQGCSHYVVADIKNAHDCEDYLFYVDAIPHGCYNDGMEAYEQCRICNTKYGRDDDGELEALTAEDLEDMIDKASHTTPGATCADTLMECTVCGNMVNPGVEHDIDWEVENAEKAEGAMLKPATCTEPGYIYDVCANCHVRDLKILEALGHREVTTTIPSTCGTYAITFTYCTRPDCDVKNLKGVDYEGGLAVSVYDELAIKYSVMVPALEEVRDLADLMELDGFKLGMDQFNENVNKTVYFTGEAKENTPWYWLTSVDPEDAVTVYIEKLENYRSRFLMYFFDAEGTKTYIEIRQNGTYVNALFTTDEPTTYWQWNATRKQLTTKVGADEYYLGTRSDQTYTTIGAVKVTSYTNCEAVPYAVGEEAGVHLISFKFDYEGGYNAAEHTYAPEMGSLNMPTCEDDGSIDYICAYCLDTVTVTLPAGCLTIAELTNMANLTPASDEELLAAKIKEPAAAEATCTKGAYIYVKCIECDELHKLVLSAPLGHEMTVEHDDSDKLSHTNRTGYVGIDCAYCDYAIKEKTLTWKDSNTLFDTLDDAMKAHGDCDLTYVNLARAGTCSVAGIEIWKCEGCQKNVRIKQKWTAKDGTEYITGEHAGHRENHKDATCYEEGWHYTYKCARCGEVVGNKAIGVKEDLKKLDHTYVELNTLLAAGVLPESIIKAMNLVEYEAAPCDDPNYGNVKYLCVVCLDPKGDGTEEHRHINLTGCKGDTIEVYSCHCGEIHIRALGSYDHKWSVVPYVGVGDKRADGSKVEKGDSDITYQAPTCYQYGWFTVVCEYCDVTALQPIAPAAHENAAGEKFTDSCLDEVTDRHCVVCCEYFAHDELGNKHDCYKTKKVNKKDVFLCAAEYHEHTYCTECEDDCAADCTEHCNGVGCAHCNGFDGGCLKFLDEGCQIPSFCHFELAEKRGSTCVEDAHELYICGDCETEQMVSAKVNKYIESAGSMYSEDMVYFYGHKPVRNADTLANYVYLDLVYQEVIINEDGDFTLTMQAIYNAEFVEYVAPTFNVEGYAKFYCEHCDAVVEQKLPKLAGMGFELDVKNANGAKEFTYGSLVEVIVSINGNEGELNSFNFAVAAGFQYVGYETLNNELFHITVTDPAKGTNYAVISGVAANTADGKMQNIEITEKTQLVKLYFRINNEMFLAQGATADIVFVPNEVKAWVSGTKTEDIAVNFLSSEVKVREFLDLDKNGVGSTSDLSMALTLLTGEHPKGATYDVTVDMNKDGAITLEDLSIAHNLLVGNIDLEDVLYLGMSEAEIEIFENLHEGGHCYSCGAELVVGAEFCSKCGLKQPTENEA